MADPKPSLAERLLAGDKRALARGISLVEDDDPEGWALVREIYPHTGSAAVVGFTGPPGAGKSTVSELLVASRSPSVLVAGDALFAFLREGRIEPWLVESNAQNEAVAEATAAATGRFARDLWTVYDGVLGPWFLPTFMTATGLATAHYVVLLPSVERCIERVATRVGHGFDDPDATRHMHDQFATATVDARHVLADPPDTVDAVAAEIMRRLATGELRL